MQNERRPYAPPVERQVRDHCRREGVIYFPDTLPFYEVIPELQRLLADGVPIINVGGDTGSGKTTALYEATRKSAIRKSGGYGGTALTQPTRIATQSAAQRMREFAPTSEAHNIVWKNL